MNNQNLRKIIDSERQKCESDIVYFAKTFCKIEHPIKGKIPFNLFDFQSNTLSEFLNHRFNIVLKSRQMGISTLCAMFGLHQMLFKENFKILIIATKADVAKNLVRKVQIMYDNLPIWLRSDIKIKNYNKHSLWLSNGSEIKAVSSSPDSARSEALSLLILDEFAFCNYAEEIWASAQSTLSTGGNAIILSTPNGVGNKFHQLWTLSEENSTNDVLGKINPIKLKWDLHPERDISWRTAQTDLLGKDIAAQECDCDFLSSGRTVIESEILNVYRERVKEPIEKRGIGGDIWIYSYPNFSKTYCVVADVGRGDGDDFSAFIIFDLDSCEQVAEYKGKIDTTLFGNMLVSISTEYNDALLVVDNKNIGWSTVQTILDKGYKNFYYSFKHDPYLDENIQLKKQYDTVDKSNMVPGFTTNTIVRPVMITKLSLYMKDNSLKLYSIRTINELQTFVWINGKAIAQRNYSDDLVMCICMFLYVRDTSLRLKQLGIDIITKSIQNIHKTAYKTSVSTNGIDQWNMLINGKKENLKWLIR